MKSVLFIITGSNGAGKSTVGATYLPAEIQKKYQIFDGDKLALHKRRELASTVKSFKEARKLADEWMYKQFDEQVKAAIQSQDHFAYEGHFRDKGTLKTPRKFKRCGYELSIIFMGLTDPDQSELRVLDRAKQGGHNVPLYELQSNFYGNLVTLNKYYKLFDEIIVIDASMSLQHQVLLHLRKSKVLFYTRTKDQPEWFTKFLPNLAKIIKSEEVA
ncbi:MAG: zeta toxin family protein [Bacteroidota bacterium]|nr:zeta toxin family protein [Bacteroidota bacterium]